MLQANAALASEYDVSSLVCDVMNAGVEEGSQSTSNNESRNRSKNKDSRS